MNAIWLTLIIYAIVEAIAAAYRVREKQRLGISPPPSVTRFKQSQRSLVQPASSANVQSESGLNKLHQLATQAANGSPILQTKTLAEIDLPLAASLLISEVVHPEMRALRDTRKGSPSDDQFDLDLVSPELAIAELETAKPVSHEHQSVLAEISQLDHADLETTIAQFQRHLNHSDETIRAASVFELGEVAAKYRGAKANEVREMLMQLSQDPNPSIRTQVVIALAKIESMIS